MGDVACVVDIFGGGGGGRVNKASLDEIADMEICVGDSFVL